MYTLLGLSSYVYTCIISIHVMCVYTCIYIHEVFWKLNFEISNLRVKGEVHFPTITLFRMPMDDGLWLWCYFTLSLPCWSSKSSDLKFSEICLPWCAMLNSPYMNHYLKSCGGNLLLLMLLTKPSHWSLRWCCRRSPMLFTICFCIEKCQWLDESSGIWRLNLTCKLCYISSTDFTQVSGNCTKVSSKYYLPIMAKSFRDIKSKIKESSGINIRNQNLLNTCTNYENLFQV